MTYIDKEKFKRKLHYIFKTYRMSETITKKVKCALDDTTVDVVEVVRCKDCKWYQESKLLAPNKFCYRLKHPTEDRQIGYNYADDDFCSYGEREEE